MHPFVLYRKAAWLLIIDLLSVFIPHYSPQQAPKVTYIFIFSSVLLSQQFYEVGYNESVWLAQGHLASFCGKVGTWTSVSQMLVRGLITTPQPSAVVFLLGSCRGVKGTPGHTSNGRHGLLTTISDAKQSIKGVYTPGSKPDLLILFIKLFLCYLRDPVQFTESSGPH